MTVLLVALAAFATIAFLTRLHAKERRELYTRIQHPHLAPSLNVDEITPTFVPFDDDEAFHAAQREALDGR